MFLFAAFLLVTDVPQTKPPVIRYQHTRHHPKKRKETATPIPPIRGSEPDQPEDPSPSFEKLWRDRINSI